MKRVLPLAIALTVAGVCCIVAAYFCHFYYTLYRNASTQLEQSVDSRIKELQFEVQRLAKQRHFAPMRVRAVISTTDQEAGHWGGEPASKPGEYQAANSKTGWWVSPELRVPAGSTARQEYEISLSPSNTRIIDAWISPPGEPEVLRSFSTFSVCPNEGTNSLHLIVCAKPDLSIRHEFTIVVVRDSDDQ